ncbi:DUF2788 domain-containing protein [Echinimonas agarilytica]|uniref:DUF2788 domain-containing protein n=1 Tax=Echinimonas agarilytica TaxID=1215918 RepID=A0AA41W8A0_9GAMM|nr:DUF2788 domain-containing protein [Echinimonas agarilytica]MCM2680794.1 DUF2788 domain-containing protein [Echinimonas agarilytica]
MQSKWLTEHWDKIESIGLYVFFAVIFFFIGMAIQDVLKRGNVPFFGRAIVWLVLFLGCAGFIAKGVIQAFFEASGTGG